MSTMRLKKQVVFIHTIFFNFRFFSSHVYCTCCTCYVYCNNYNVMFIVLVVVYVYCNILAAQHRTLLFVILRPGCPRVMDSQEEFATYVRKTSSRAKYVNYTVHTLMRLESVTMLIYITEFNFVILISLKHLLF